MVESNSGSLSKVAYPLGNSFKWIGYILVSDYLDHSITIADATHKLVSDGFCRSFLPVNSALTFESIRRGGKNSHAPVAIYPALTFFLKKARCI